MTKNYIISRLFRQRVAPVYAHIITGEKYPYDEYWNEITNYDIIDTHLANIKAKNGEKLTKKTKRMLLVTGWMELSNSEFVKTRFEII